MPCIHGLDENNCPTCRISNSTFPLNPINKKNLNENTSDSLNHLFKNKLSGNMNFEEDISPLKSNIRPNLIHNLPKPKLINSIPTFENKLFLERIESLSIEKPNDLSKITLETPDLNLDEE